ncbi:MAG TPA: glycosyltransferase family 4 protein [bacterium]|nr:glycosyltransferase family 4 protein [bacterium]
MLIKRIAFLGPSEAIHFKRWIKYFSEKNWEVAYIGFNNNLNEYEKYLKKIYIINPAIKKIQKILCLKKYINDFKPSIIIFHYIDYKILFCLFTKNIPIILCCYGYDVFKAPRLSIFFKYVFRYIGNYKAQLIISIAEHMTRELIEYIGIKKDKIYTSSWGCDTKIFFRNKNIERSEKKIRIICPRGFEPHYNWQTIIKAIKIVVSKNENYEFIFTNSGREEEAAKKMVKDFQLEKCVKFLGLISPEEMAIEYNKSHIYISMSLIDGNNISLNEAMNCGCFPICSNTPATKQWIINEYNGLIMVDNFSAEELAEKILSVEYYSDKIQNMLKINFEIIKQKADFYKNLNKIEDKLKEVIYYQQNKIIN